MFTWISKQKVTSHSQFKSSSKFRFFESYCERDGQVIATSHPFCLLRRECHLRNAGMRQQLLPVAPHQLFAHLGLERDLDCLEILQPALRRDEGVIRAEQEAILQTRGSFAQQYFGNELR